ncbi:MAG: hypothetical protein ACLFNB_01855 [Candidatus Woesearchaeota archaeon]
MRKLLLPLFIVLIAITLTACNDDTGSNEDKVKPFIGGTRGISMEFVEGAPPQSILDAGQTTFSIQTRLTNEGEQNIEMDGDVNYLEVSVEGIVPQQFGLPADDDLKLELQDDLQGGKKYPDGTVNPGSSTILSWDGLSYPSDLQGNDEKSFLVNLCYDYMTKSTSRICLSDDSSSALFDKQSKDICDITAPKTTYNSGGPVHVQNVRQNTAGGNKVSVMFDVVHVGNGAVYEFGEAECDPSLNNRKNKGKVDVTASLPESTPASISCGRSWENDGSNEVSGAITLLGSESDDEDGGRQSTTVNCIIESDAGGTVVYDESLSIDLKYRYSQNERKTITIKDVGSSDE